MNKQEGQSFADTVYLRALIMSHERLQAIKNANEVFGKRPINKTDIGQSKDSCCYIVVKSSEPPPVQLSKTLGGGENGLYPYRVYVSDVHTGDFHGLLVAAPLKNLLKSVRPNLNLTYARCDLRIVCDDQYRGPGDPSVRITRLNCRVYGDTGEAVSSIALYGTNVMDSKVLRDVLGQQLPISLGKEMNGPFKAWPLCEGNWSTRKQSRWLLPNSFQLRWDDGSGQVASLNVDRFGNFSFFMKDLNTIQVIHRILGYVSRLGALVADISIDPLKRSDEALEGIPK